jgi:hypothetical protein
MQQIRAMFPDSKLAPISATTLATQAFADYLASAFPKPNLNLNHRCAAGHRAAALRLLAYPGIIWETLVWLLPYESHRLQAFG